MALFNPEDEGPDYRAILARALAQQSGQSLPGTVGAAANLATGFGSGFLGAQLAGERRLENEQTRDLVASILAGGDVDLSKTSSRAFRQVAPLVLQQRQQAAEAARRQQERGEDRGFQREQLDYRRQEAALDREQRQQQFEQELGLRRAQLGARSPNEFTLRTNAAIQLGLDPNTPEGQRFILTGQFGQPDRPLSEIGRIQADIQAGRITPEQGQIAIQQTQRPPTAEQSGAAGFANRLDNALPIIQNFESAGTDRVGRALSQIPLFGNSTTSPELQQLQQAERDFINATLRRESGAAISESEFENARRQYLPQPGDGPEVLAQKAKNRDTVLGSLRQAAGSAYKPQTASRGTSAESPNSPSPLAAPKRMRFDASGNLIE